MVAKNAFIPAIARSRGHSNQSRMKSPESATQASDNVCEQKGEKLTQVRQRQRHSEFYSGSTCLKIVEAEVRQALAHQRGTLRGQKMTRKNHVGSDPRKALSNALQTKGENAAQ